MAVILAPEPLPHRFLFRTGIVSTAHRPGVRRRPGLRRYLPLASPELRGQSIPSEAHTRPSQTAQDQPMPQTDVGRSEDLLAELSKWVALETPTTDPTAVNRLMDLAEAELARAGAALTRIPG